MKKYYRYIPAIIVLLFIFIGLYYGERRIETNLKYPNNIEWFSDYITTNLDSMSCLDFSYAYSIDLYNKNSIEDKRSKGGAIVDHNFYFYKKECTPRNISIDLMVSNLTNYYYDITPKLEIEPITSLNEKDNNTIEIIIQSTSLKDYTVYNLKITAFTNGEFFNYYRISSPTIRWGDKSRIDFYYDRKNYICEQDCISVVNPENLAWRKEEPIEMWKRYTSKTFFINGQELIIRFNPKSYFWSFIQNLLDAILIGIIVSLTYSLLIFIHRRFFK